MVAYMMAPGLAELSEAATHLVLHGDSAHAGGAGHAKQQHDKEGDEHGCSGTFHLCSCCHVTIKLSEAANSSFLVAASLDLAYRATEGILDSGVRGDVFRPPIA